MTKQEVSEQYGIPEKILEEYESWGLYPAVKRKMKNWQYDSADIEKLSLILTLHDIGFEASEVEAYMRLVLKGDKTQAEQLLMLNQKRRGALDEIHFREKQIDRLDYLRHEIRMKQAKK